MDNYVSSSPAISSTGTDAIVAAILGVGLVVILLSLAIAIITIVGMWKVLKKGNKPGWAALIPFYNSWCLCEVAGINPMWVLIVLLSPILNIIPIIGAIAAFAVDIYFLILLYVSLARSFGKSEGFSVGLLLLPPVFTCILGFGSSEYIGPHPIKDIIFKDYQPQSNPNINESTQMNPNNTPINQPVIPATDNAQGQASVTNNTNQKFCPACGNPIPDGASYCTNCGKPIN